MILRIELGSYILPGYKAKLCIWKLHRIIHYNMIINNTSGMAPSSPGASPPHVLVVGAGPIGLEAAVACAQAGFAVTVAERGPSVASAVRDWGHVRLFSPNSLNNSAAGLAALGELGCGLPAPRGCPTGTEYVDDYLEPLARWIEEQPRCEVLLSTSIESISRGSLLKGEAIKGVGAKERDHTPFAALLLDCVSGDERLLAGLDAVIDCSGTYGNGNHVGRGGALALGERALRAEVPATGKPRTAFFDGIPDVLDRDLSSFLPHAGARNLSVAVVGGGYSAATTINALVDLAASRANTFKIDVEWFLRKPAAKGAPYAPTGGADDPLPSRAKLVELANHVAGSHDGGGSDEWGLVGGRRGNTPIVRVHRGVGIESVRRDAEGKVVVCGTRDAAPHEIAGEIAGAQTVATGGGGGGGGGGHGTDGKGATKGGAGEALEAHEASAAAGGSARGDETDETDETAASSDLVAGEPSPMAPPSAQEAFELRVDTFVSLVGHLPPFTPLPSAPSVPFPPSTPC